MSRRREKSPLPSPFLSFLLVKKEVLIAVYSEHFTEISFELTVFLLLCSSGRLYEVPVAVSGGHTLVSGVLIAQGFNRWFPGLALSLSHTHGGKPHLQETGGSTRVIPRGMSRCFWSNLWGNDTRLENLHSVHLVAWFLCIIQEASDSFFKEEVKSVCQLIASKKTAHR